MWNKTSRCEKSNWKKKHPKGSAKGPRKADVWKGLRTKTQIESATGGKHRTEPQEPSRHSRPKTSPRTLGEEHGGQTKIKALDVEQKAGGNTKKFLQVVLKKLKKLEGGGDRFLV